MSQERSLLELLDLIDAKPTDSFIMERAVDAYQAGLISEVEMRHLRAFEGRSAKSRKRALADTVDVSDEAVDAARTKLAGASEALRAYKEQRGL